MGTPQLDRAPAPETRRPLASVIVPVRNDAVNLAQCLEHLRRSAYAPLEIVVVDDGSDDASAEVAARYADQVVRLAKSAGAGEARNQGVAAATGEILVFIDADVCARPETVTLMVETLTETGQEPAPAAVFGSYDRRPGCPAFVSDFRNLLSHHTHQAGAERSSIFFTGCGAMRRDVFLSLGGFRPGHRLEDIELGLRALAEGHAIRNDKRILVQHLKRVTFLKFLRTDITYRGIPWTLMLLAEGKVRSDLALGKGQRVAALSFLASGALLAALCCIQPLFAAWGLGVAVATFVLERASARRPVPRPLAAGLAVAVGAAFGALAITAPLGAAALGLAAAGVVVPNVAFYALLVRERGLGYAFFAYFLHLVYYFCAVVSLIAGIVLHLRR